MTTIAKAINHLGRSSSPQWFFIAEITSRELVQDDSQPTMMTDGKSIWYNSKYVAELQADECAGDLAHEVMHIVSLHHLRLMHLHPELANVAADLVIDLILTDAGFKLPKGCLIEPRFRGMSVEQVAKQLLAEGWQPQQGGLPKSGQPKPGNNIGQRPGDVMIGGFKTPQGKSGGKPGKAELADLEREIITRAVASANVAGMAGNIPGAIRELVVGHVKTKVRWQDVVREFPEVVTRKDYDWEVPEPYYYQQEMFLPSLAKKGRSGIVVALDVSGSIDIELCSEIIAESQKIMDELEPEWLRVIQFDTLVQSDNEYQTGDMIKENPTGRGGTKFGPLFRHIEEQGYNPGCIIVLTDMDNGDRGFKSRPECPTLWVSYARRKLHASIPAPFGELVEVD